MAEDAEKKKEAEDATAAPIPEKVRPCLPYMRRQEPQRGS
jgi:hypothetical protein